MLAFLADENFNYRIVKGALRLHPKLNIVRVQEVGLSGADDPSVLQWAAEQARAVLTHDVNTMRRFALDRVQYGLRMPGLLLVKNPPADMNAVIQDIVLMAQCSWEGEWEGREHYLPLR